MSRKRSNLKKIFSFLLILIIIGIIYITNNKEIIDTVVEGIKVRFIR